MLVADFHDSLAPKYEELGSLFASSDKVIVAKVDATANDVPDEIQGFPTIKLYPAKAKDSPIEYSGSRSVDDLAKFIKENGSFNEDASAKRDLEDADVDTEDMPKQAPAATKSGASAAEKATDKAKEGVAAKVAEKVKEAAEAAATVMIDDDGDKVDHDEL